MNNLDSSDSKVLRKLMREGRASWTELADLSGVSAPAAADRVRRLEQRGVIRGFAALVDPEAVGYPVTAFVAVTLDRAKHRGVFLKQVQKTAEIVECHRVSGEDDYLLKVRCRSTRDLDRLLSEDLKGMPGVVRTCSTVVLSSPKETAVCPVADQEGGQ